MNAKFGIMTTLILGLAATACVEVAGPEDEGEEAIPCGMRACEAAEVDPEWGPELPPSRDGKADADSIRTAVVALTGDGRLEADDVARLFEETGDRVSQSELDAIRAALEDSTYEIGDGARARALELALVANLPAEEAAQLRDGRTMAGTPLPEPVRELLAEARLRGAVAYDVNEVDEDGERLWTPYPATTPPLENMSFEYTEITPEVLAGDLADAQVEYNRIVGEETLQHPQGFEYRAARYEPAKGGTGNVLAHYDEVYHPDIYARGRSGQKWANNCGFMSDGSVHCLPASRRSFKQDLILTNPHLSRGKHMLYHGHIDVREGVVIGVEISGRLSKLAAKGDAVFLDPIAMLEAWGFEISPRVTLRYGNTRHGTPVREDGVVKAAQ